MRQTNGEEESTPGRVDGHGRVRLTIRLQEQLFHEIAAQADACEITPREFAEQAVEAIAASRRLERM